MNIHISINTHNNINIYSIRDCNHAFFLTLSYTSYILYSSYVIALFLSIN